MTMLVNGRTLEADGIVVATVSGWAHGPGVQRDAIPVDGLAGAVPATRQITGARTLRVGVVIRLDVLTDRPAALQRLHDRLAGQLWIRFPDWPDRVLRAYCTSIAVQSVVSDAAFAAPALEATVDLVAYSATSDDAEPRVLAISTVPTPIALGTAPCGGIVNIHGPRTEGDSVTLRYRDAGGLERGALTLTVPLGASVAAAAHVEADLWRQYVTLVAADGTRTNAYNWLSGGAWFALDPAHGDRGAAAWPTLELTSGAGALLYRRGYAL